jgi:hypothetical protein
MSDDVNIKISATDNATATLRAVQGELGKFSASVKNLASLTVAGFGVQQVSSFLLGTVKEYAEAQASQVRLASVIKATGNTTRLTLDEIYDFAGGLESTTGTAAESIQDAAAQLARFRTIGGDTFKEVLTLANDMSKVLGGDVSSSAVTLAKALNSPAEGLSKLNVTFTEVQKEQIKSLDEMGMKAEAQAKILDEIRRQFGGAGADFGGTVAGQLEILNHEIGTLKEAIGVQLAPIVRDLLSVISGRSPGSVTADTLLADTRVGSTSGEQQRLVNLRKAQASLEAEQERNRQIVADIVNSPIRSAFSPIRNAAAIDALADGDARIQAIGEAIKAQDERIARAMQQAIISTQQQRLREIDQQQNTDFFGFLAQGGALGGVNGLAQVTAEDVGMAIGRQIRGIVAGQEGNVQTREQSLQATESRFLTRGRGQLTTAEQKNLEEQKKQTDLLRRIEWAFANFATAENLLVVEGVN